MAGSVWLTHRDMNATSSQPRARRSRRWLKGLNAPSPARCRSPAWTARNPARASRSASVKGLQSALAQPGDKRGAEPAGLPGIDHGYPASAVPGWSGGKRHGPFGLFRNEAWCLSSAPGPALAGAAQPLLIARAYGATASIAFSILGRPGGR